MHVVVDQSPGDEEIGFGRIFLDGFGERGDGAAEVALFPLGEAERYSVVARFLDRGRRVLLVLPLAEGLGMTRHSAGTLRRSGLLVRRGDFVVRGTRRFARRAGLLVRRRDLFLGIRAAGNEQCEGRDPGPQPVRCGRTFHHGPSSKNHATWTKTLHGISGLQSLQRKRTAKAAPAADSALYVIATLI